MANSVDPDQTAPIGAVCSGSTLFASLLNLSVMLGNYLQQTTSADDIFRCIFFMALYGLTGLILEICPIIKQVTRFSLTQDIGIPDSTSPVWFCAIAIL